MSRKELVAAFGKVEGGRLFSQITISRNTSGFKTARSSELKEILAKARKKSEREKKAEEEEEGVVGAGRRKKKSTTTHSDDDYSDDEEEETGFSLV